MAKRHMRRLSRLIIIREIQIKLQWGTTPHQPEWLSSKSPQTGNAGEGIEGRKPSYTAGGMQIGAGAMESIWRFFKKLKQSYRMIQQSHSPGRVPRENYNGKDTHTQCPPQHVYSSETRKQPKCPSTEEWMKRMAHIYNGISLGH